ncbi:hypothetical protein AB3662_05820 [Sorangium cellulosum]|uniref:hypothetical protein n=1 Tax=Sorangium cellulosum TaxID=56 RepID=UPI003D9A80FE
MRRCSWSSLGSTAALAVASAGCTAPAMGELMVAVQTDMAVPKDLDHVEMEVLSDGNPVILNDLKELGPNRFQLPGTRGLTVSEDPSREIRIRVRALLGKRIRVEHTVLTTVPEDRVATLWVPLHFLCSMDAEGGEAREPDLAGACPDDPACAAAACGERRVSAASLPDYAEQDVLHHACFDAAKCFQRVSPLEDGDLDAEDCTIAARDGDVNIAIATEGDGACGAAGCFVPLDAESDFGWRRRDDGRIALPKALCSPGRLARLGVVVSPVTPSCPPKQIAQPLCPADEGRPVVLAARQRSPIALAVSEDGVFWTEQGTLSDEHEALEHNVDGAVKRVARVGGPPETIASKQAVPRHLALGDGDEVFWTNRGVAGAAATALMRWSPGGGNARPWLNVEQLGHSGSLEALAMDGESLFWTQLPDGGALGRVGFAMLDPRDEPAPATLADTHHANRMAAANNVVCWTDVGQDSAENDTANGSVQCKKRSSSEIVSVGAGERKPYGVALDAENPAEVFWVNFEGEVVRASLDGARRDVIFQDLDAPGPYGIALDERRVYWTNRIQGTVNVLPRDAPPGSACRSGACTLATGQLNPGAIAVDGDAIYWINEGSPVVGSTGKADGAVVRLARPPPP